MAIPKKIRKPSDDEIEKRVKISLEDASKNKTAPEELKVNHSKEKETQKTKKIPGRPPKPEYEKLSEKVLVSFTKEEHAKLDKLARMKYGIVIPVPVIIRGLLKEIGVI